MSEELAARLVVGIEGPQLQPREEAWLSRWRPAGVVLFRRNVVTADQLRTLCRGVRRLLRADAEIVADQEGGAVSVLAAALGRPPAAFGLGWLDDVELTRRVHRETARRAGEMGIGRLLAPCADVLVEPENPVIGSRAFGSDVSRVARHVAAAVSGLREGGVAACLKHWPGHGGTRCDSHDSPAAGPRGFSREPFAAGLAAGADAIMVGHLLVEGSGSEPQAPATLSGPEISRARGMAAGRPLRLYADDVSMGSLWPAMRAAGIVGGEPEQAGIQDPARLPLAWFDRLVRAGCDRLLCWRIPWGAFPCADASEPSDHLLQAAGADPFAGSDLPDATLDELPSYAEVRSLLASRVRDDCDFSRAETILWWDATGGDRWGGPRDLRSILDRHFTRVVPWTPSDGGPLTESFGWLLVTSHRPLSAIPSSAILQAAPWDVHGCAIAMGHPVLADELSRFLPPAWRIGRLFDARTADLAPVLVRRGPAGTVRGGV
jgi:hypothetical protein